MSDLWKRSLCFQVNPEIIGRSRVGSFLCTINTVWWVWNVQAIVVFVTIVKADWASCNGLGWRRGYK